MKYHPVLLTMLLWITNPSLPVSAQDGTVPPVDPAANPSEPELPAVSADADKAEPETNKLTAENLIITRSDDRTEVRGFSATKGTWENLALPKSDSFEWYAHGNMATVRAADTLAAFSSETGHWDVLKLSKESKAVCVTQGSITTIEDGGHFYTFSAKTSSWTSPTDTRLAFGQMLLPSMELSPDTLAAFQAWSDSQPRYKTFSLTAAVDGVRLQASRKEYLDEALNMLNKLIAESQQAANTTSHKDWFAADPGSANSGNADPNSIISRSPSPDEIQRMSMRINSLKRDAVHREGMLKVFARGRDLSKSEVMKELREATAVAFDKRQEWYEAEAKRLEMRLERIQSEIAQRKSTREKIIERQLQQLTTLERVSSGSPSGQPDELDIIHNEVPPTPADNEFHGNPKRAAMPESMVSASPIELARALRQAKTLVEYMKEDSKRAEEFIARYSQPLDVLKNDVLEKGGVVSAGFTQEFVDNQRKQAEASLKVTKEQLRVAQKDWKLLWAEYESQIRILNSELDSAKIKTEQAAKLLEISRPLAQQGVIPQSELHSHEAIVAASEQEVIRANERLKLLLIVKEQQSELMPPPAAANPTSPTGKELFD